MKYKVIKSAAHNWGDSFASTLNYWQNDYVMSHLARAALDNAIPELHADLLSGDAGPPELLTEPVRHSLQLRIADTPRFLESHNIPVAVISRAALIIRFDLDSVRPTQPGAFAVPFEVVINLTDDRGTVHTGRVANEWYTDPYRPAARKRSWWRFWQWAV